MASTKAFEKRLIPLAMFIIGLYYLPYVLWGQDSTLRIHDNLDSNLAWVKILLDRGALFGAPDELIPNVMNGLPHAMIYPYYDFPLIIFKFFGMYWGYVVNKFLISLIGFWGLYLLLQKHFLPQEKDRWINVSCALLFSLLPFWSFTATVCGIPFALYAFLNIRQGEKQFHNWLIIILFAFHSSLILSGVFLLILLAMLWFWDFFKKRNMNWPFFLALSSLSLLYLLSHYPTIIAFLDSPVSHRNAFLTPDLSLRTALNKSAMFFLVGQSHAHSLHTLLILPVAAMIFYRREISSRFRRIALFLILTSLFFGLKDFGPIKHVLEIITDKIPIQLQRFHYLHPGCWYLLLALSASILVRKLKYGKLIMGTLLIAQLAYIISYHELIQYRKKDSFREFYAEKSFLQAKKLIAKAPHSYRVISVGIHPAVAQYNRFYTLDAYLPSYPLAYKEQFGRAIRGELNRDPKLRDYFDHWGSRCYAFSSEIGPELPDSPPLNINHLSFDFDQFKAMGAAYLFTYSEITASKNPSLKLLGTIPREGAKGNLYVYEIH
ncbi:MAG: hypothetical protein EP338_12930 [Bacteroidetes bacterium]|nr:MAG: hypothetical protein EP338_12930 [Bacteroidota bacterium]